MKSLAYSFSLLALILSSCGASKKGASLSAERSLPQPPPYSIRYAVSAADLSEDGTAFSTKNDELLLLLYIPDGNGNPASLAGSFPFVLDKNKTTTSGETGLTEKPKEVIVVLIELDSERPAEQIEPVIRTHFPEIYSLYRKHDLKGMKKYLQDEDVLGITTLKLTGNGKAVPAEFRGVQVGDTYHYLLRISALY